MFRRKRSPSDFNAEIEAHIRLETAVVLAMGLLGLVGTWIPAKCALSIDPAILLREE